MADILDYQLPEHLAARRSAERREWGIQAKALSLALVCFVAAGFLVRPMNQIRKEHQLLIDPTTVKGLPPDLALLGKLGTFRALAIDWASIRAERLKEEGKTYEALQLHMIVCSLAPRFASVWANAAWNMAYNISVMQYSPEARWKWVRNGIELLRDHGIPNNPRSIILYKELAWIFWHKIGDFMDDEHLNYKRALAVEMESVLGAPPIIFGDEEYFAWFRKIVDAPRELNTLIEADPRVAAVVTRMDALKFAPDLEFLAFVARHVRPEIRAAALAEEALTLDPLTTRRLELVNDPELAEPLDLLLAAVRSKVLRDTYKLDLDWMQNIMEVQYGPLDWRNPYAHSLYWSTYGEKVTRGHENMSRTDRINNSRNAFHTVQAMIDKGRVTLWPNFDDPFSSYMDLAPDTRYIPYLYEAYLRVGKELFGDDPRFIEGTPGPIYRTGFVSNMHRWIHLLYLEGGARNLELAEKFYVWLRVNNPHADGRPQEPYTTTVEEFVMRDIRDQLQTWRAARSFVGSLSQQALKHLALGQKRQGLRDLVRAENAHETWQAATSIDFNERRQLQPFSIIVRDEIEVYVKDPRVGPLYKVTLWENLPDWPKKMTYDRLLPYFVEICNRQEPPWSRFKAFLEPPGMDEFRKLPVDTAGQIKRGEVDSGRRFKK